MALRWRNLVTLLAEERSSGTIEALMTAPTENSSEDHTVGEVFQTGYRFRGNLLRPARVQVRKHEG